MKTEDFPLVIIPCGSKKGVYPARAEDLYQGAFFRVCVTYAKTLTVPERIMILSAKHGFITLDEIVSPYNMKMGSRRAKKTKELRRQAKELGIIDESKVISIGGLLYTTPCTEIWKGCKTPLQELPKGSTMGKQMSWMKGEIEKKTGIPYGAKGMESFS